jgi:photosystem II stability/assembly factor-like uncharacterized protein
MPDGQIVRSLAVDSSGYLYASSYSGVWRSTDNGFTWEQFRTGVQYGTYNPIVTVGDTLIGAFQDTLFVSNDRGETWTPRWIPEHPGLLYPSFRKLIATDQYIYLGSDIGAHRSSDLGMTWTEVEQGFVNTSTAVRDYYQTPTTLYAASSNGVYRSNDDGDNWTRLYTTGDRPLTPVSVLRSDGRLFAGRGSFGVSISEDDGASWTRMQSVGGVDSNTVFTLNKFNGILYAGTARYFTTSGVYFSLDNGDTWYPLNDGIGQSDWIFDLLVHGDYIYAATQGASVLRRPLSDFVTNIAEEHMVVPAGFSLDQNYPNPFNPSTNIRFSLPEASAVRVEVFNILGQTVAVLQEGDLQAGYHTVQWNAQVTSGLYIYRIEATSTSNPGVTFKAVKKMMFLK